jgi:hypothetical protein
MANKARGAVKLELGGKTYVLTPEFGVVAEIEDELDTEMFKLGQKIERLDFKARDLVRTLQVILKANGHDIGEAALAEAVAEQGAASLVVPLIAFARGYIWGGRAEKKAGGADRANAPESPENQEKPGAKS